MEAEDTSVKFFEHVLSSRQQKILRELGPIAERMNFYLAGGTAIALYVGHRSSFDFDWFTQEHLRDPLQLAKDFQTQNISLIVRSVDRGTLHVSIAKTKTSFFEYRYPLIRQTVRWDKYECSLASLDDLLCMKLAAIAQRGSRKDFVDLYAVLTKGLRLTQALKMYRKKFSIEDVSHLMYSLSYFDDADAEPMPRMLRQVNWETIKETLRREVKALI